MTGTSRTHPDMATLIAWLDEPGDADPSVAAHVERCSACAGHARALRSVLEGVASEPALPDPDAMAVARGRILDAIGEAEREPGPERAGTPVRRLAAKAWAPLLAAAALAALLLWSPGEEPPGEEPPPAGVVAGAPTPVAPVAAEAEAAAEAVVAAVAAEPVEGLDESAVALDDEAVASLEALDAATPTLADEDDYESTLLADRFASLPEEDRDAILDELSEITFEL